MAACLECVFFSKNNSVNHNARVHLTVSLCAFSRFFSGQLLPFLSSVRCRILNEGPGFLIILLCRIFCKDRFVSKCSVFISFARSEFVSTKKSWIQNYFTHDCFSSYLFTL